MASKAFGPKELLGFGVAVALGCLIAYDCSAAVGLLFVAEDTFNVWFQADVPRVLQNMTEVNSHHYRTSVHPISSIILAPVVLGISAMSEVPPIHVATGVVAGLSGLSAGLLFLALRWLALPYFVAALMTAIYLGSAAYIHWSGVVEHCGPNAFSITVGIVFLVYGRTRNTIWWMLGSAVTLSFTVTNWMVGIVATFARWKARKAVLISSVALGAVMVLAVVQHFTFFGANLFFMPKSIINEVDWVVPVMSNRVESAKWRPWNSARSLLVTTLVAPGPTTEGSIEDLSEPVVTNQHPRFSDMTWGELVATIAWLGLLGIGTWGMRRTQRLKPVAAGLAVMILGQVGLHLVYGDLTFIYGPNIAPMLIMAAAFGWFTPARTWSVVLALIVLFVGSANNYDRRNEALALARKVTIESGAQRMLVEQQMYLRPGDPWPRRSAHVLIGPRGADLKQKAYIEPAGAFSPAFRTFGLSFWVVRDDGSLVATSHDIPLGETKARYIRDDQGRIGLNVATPYYSARWMTVGLNDYRLSVEPRTSVRERLLLSVRSVGPAGGPLETVDVVADGLRLNNAWHLRSPERGAVVFIGREGAPGWRKPQSIPGKSAEDPGGWLHARIALAANKTSVFGLSKTSTTGAQRAMRSQARVSLSGAGAGFVESINAQMTTLAMGRVDASFVNKDPEENAYAMLALARSGQVGTAGLLVPTVSEAEPVSGEPDFGLWSLGSLGSLLNDRAFDETVFPSIRRRVASIEGAVAKEGDSASLSTLELVVAEAGLRRAVDLSARLGRTSEASRWRSLRRHLQTSTRGAFATKEDARLRGFWPSFAGDRTALSEQLQERWPKWEWDWSTRRAWARKRTPGQTRLWIGELHQWLRQGYPDRVQAGLSRIAFFDPFPDLNVLWAAAGADRHVRPWQDARGWVRATRSTPDYLSTAEMLLLQLDILAYARQRGDETFELKVGAGVTEDWLKTPISVSRAGTTAGFVDWSWDGQRLRVVHDGRVDSVTMGKAFPRDVAVEVEVRSQAPR